MKQLDMTQSVHDLIQATPELTDILRSLGFAAITSKAMFETAARMVTLEQAAAMKHIDMNRAVLKGISDLAWSVDSTRFVPLSFL